jgi:heterotetrameric sarcosine oxidase gamma subunit
VSFEFLAPDAAVSDDRFAPVARTPMERDARAAGARFELRDGWNVAVGYTSREQELEAVRRAAGWADVSHLGKLEIHASADDLAAIVATVAGTSLKLGTAARVNGAWWLPVTADRVFVVCESAAVAGLRDRVRDAAASASNTVSVVDATSKYAAMTIAGPLAREVFARFSALDLRPSVTPVHAFRPGSIARGPALLVREGEERYTFFFGWALGQYMWETVSDAARHLGGAPIGLDALEGVAIADAPAREEASRA